MKKTNLLLLAALALLATAFGVPSRHQQAPSGTQKNFVYLAYPSDNPIDLSDPLNYELTANDGTEIPFCSGVAHRCSVVAEDDGTGHPDFSRPYLVKTRS